MHLREAVLFDPELDPARRVPLSIRSTKFQGITLVRKRSAMRSTVAAGSPLRQAAELRRGADFYFSDGVI